jgi:sugar phosphate isomerase/epimerase
MNRRRFIGTAAAAAIAPVIGPSKPRRLAVSAASYGIRQRLSRRKDRPADVPVFHDSLHFLEHCHALGAGGVQISVRNWADGDAARKLRERAEEYDMVLEGQIGLPKSESATAEFERSVRASKEIGVRILRCVMLGGRRYESFPTRKKWKQFQQDSWTWLARAEPIARKHGVTLALENHKDWRVDEMVALLERISSEHVGVNLDTGNNIALLENPMQVVESLAPYTVTTHLKDMAVQEYPDGFLLSEVPFGEGFLDIPLIIRSCEKARPTVQFNLEMITRDPLKIPCLTQGYWKTFGQLSGRVLAESLALVRKNPAQSLPRIEGISLTDQVAFEEENNRKCFRWFEQFQAG